MHRLSRMTDERPDALVAVSSALIVRVLELPLHFPPGSKDSYARQKRRQSLNRSRSTPKTRGDGASERPEREGDDRNE
jgi:hypothetical protein